MMTNVLINGEMSDGRIPVTDSTVLRGDGCFEVIRSYGGTPFATEEHLDRLEVSAAALMIDLPPRRLIREWVEKTAADLGDGAVRVVVSRGSGLPGGNDPSRVIVFGHDIEAVSGALRLYPVPAPWHAAGVRWDLSGSKVTSYAPNMSASRRARMEGRDDALLVTPDEIVLEGPTFAVAWVHGNAVETPTLDLGILDSITRRIVIELARSSGLEVIEGVWAMSRLSGASEVMAWSTVREVQAVEAVGALTWEPGPVTADLAARFGERTGWGTRDH
jgi:branched-subunit amino acid aminotransferase/4-amino-4-deoxychorismate lyase